MRRLPRWVLFAAVVVVLALAGLTSVTVGTVRQSFPRVEGELALSGLTQPVEVLRDAYGVPQIYADNAEDLFEAQGFVQAQDRFYEMDFRRHLAAGRLSELYGASQIETDSYIRTLGWRRVAEQELSLLSPSTRRYLDAYAAGVNAYLAGKPPEELSLEYSLLGVQGLDYTPELWTAADSVSFLKVMAWDLGTNADIEADRAIIATLVGTSRAASLYPPHPFEGHEEIVGRGAVVDGEFDPEARRASASPLPASLDAEQSDAAVAALRAADQVHDVLPAVLGVAGLTGEIGSNAWAVSGSRTAGGQAILSNDPHLATSIPSVFAQVGLRCRTVTDSCPFDVSGFSLASVPGVMIGKNTSIAWGLTTSYPDVQDLFLEDVRGDTVRDGETYVPLTIIEEHIKVRGEADPRLIRIRSTRHGPLLSDVDQQLQAVAADATEPDRDAYAVALSWTASTPGRTMDAVLGLDQAHNFTDFRAAAALLSAPSQNLIYADTAGNIGYQLPGAIPIRDKGNGQGPRPGWDRSYDWQGTIPFAELPYAYNPPNGFIVAANQPIIGKQYPYLLGSSYSYGWRSQEIVDRLREAPPLTLDSAEQLFYDDTLRVAADLVPALLKVKVADGWVQEGQRTLVGWDYSASAGSASAAYFNVVFHDLLKLTFRDELPQAQWPTGGDRWYAVVDGLLDRPRDAWWDDVTTKDVVETRDDILLAAMTMARKEITSAMSRDPAGWQWGKLHTATLRNQTLGTSGIGVVERLFNRGPYAVDGGPGVVNAMGYDDTLGYQVVSAPTMRMLVDLGDPDRSRWVNQSGASGHAYHRNYDDQTELWATNRMWAFPSTRGAVEAASTERLQLVPSG